METQKTPHSQINLEERKMESTFATSEYITKLQSPREYVTGTETEIQNNGTRQKAQRQTHTAIGILSLTKEARIYDGEKIVSSIRGAGKTRQLHVKE